MIYDMDGYQDYSAAQLLREHVRLQAGGGGGALTLVSGGRNGGNRLRCYQAQSSNLTTATYVCRALPSAVQTLAWGHYVTITSLAARVYLYDVRDSTQSHVGISVLADGSIGVYRGSTAYDYSAASNASFYGNSYTLLGLTDPGVVLVNEPFAFKALVTISDTVGVVQLYVNGESVLELTDVDTRNAGTETVTNLLYGVASGSAAMSIYYEDFWCGSAMLSGDRRVDSHYPIQDGANTGFTPSAGSDHYAMVDEATADDDTTKVTGTAVDTRDTYKVETFKNAGGAIDAVKIVLTALKVAPNSAQLAACVQSDGAPHDGTAQGLTTTWMHVSEVIEEDPGTAAPWDESAFGAAGTAEFGMHKAA